MSETVEQEALDQERDRTLGKRLFNRTWELLGLSDRTPDQDAEAIHTAHASAYHWTVGAPEEPIRRARGEWLCSRVYATLGRPEPALWHAARCLEIAEALDLGEPVQQGREEWDLAGAYEGLARAHLLAGNVNEARLWAERCRQALETVTDAEDRKWIEVDLRSLGLDVTAEPPG